MYNAYQHSANYGRLWGLKMLENGILRNRWWFKIIIKYATEILKSNNSCKIISI